MPLFFKNCCTPVSMSVSYPCPCNFNGLDFEFFLQQKEIYFCIGMIVKNNHQFIMPLWDRGHLSSFHRILFSWSVKKFIFFYSNRFDLKFIIVIFASFYMICGKYRFIMLHGRYGPPKEKSWRQARKNLLKPSRYWRESLVTSLTLGVKYLGSWTFLLSPSTAGSLPMRSLATSI